MNELELDRYILSDPSLVLYLPLWKHDGSQFMSDDRHGRLCTVTGALWTPQGRSFDGTDDNITIPRAVSQAITGAAGITIIGWFRILDASSNDVFYLANAFGSTRVAMAYNSSQDFLTVVRSGVEAAQIATFITDNPSTMMFHAAVIDLPGQTITQYRGETSQITSGLSFASTTFIDSTHATFNNIGGNVGAGNYFKGTIDEVILYRRMLSNIEISNIYEATKWRYK